MSIVVSPPFRYVRLLCGFAFRPGPGLACEVFCLRFLHPSMLRFSSLLETLLLPPTSTIFSFVLTQACSVFISLCCSQVHIYPPAPALSGKVSVSLGKCGYLTALPRQARGSVTQMRAVMIHYVRVPVMTETAQGRLLHAGTEPLASEEFQSWWWRRANNPAVE